MPDFSSYLDYWPNPTFTALGLEQGYIIANHIVTAADVLKIFSSMEPFELATAINNSILFHKLDKIYDFPRPFLLCKTRYDDANDRMLYFLLENEELYPFSYEWTDGGLSFDFRGLVFQESIIREIEYSAFNLDFNLKHGVRHLPDSTDSRTAFPGRHRGGKPCARADVCRVGIGTGNHARQKR